MLHGILEIVTSTGIYKCPQSKQKSIDLLKATNDGFNAMLMRKQPICFIIFDYWGDSGEQSQEITRGANGLAGLKQSFIKFKLNISLFTEN